jgi:hypothetical protein
MPHFLIFLLGAGAAVVLKAVGGSVARPVVKGVVKTGIKLGRQMQQFAAEVSEDFQDVTAEASSEIDNDARRVRTPNGPKGA